MTGPVSIVHETLSICSSIPIIAFANRRKRPVRPPGQGESNPQLSPSMSEGAALQQLLEMGIPRSRAKAALIKSKWDVMSAAVSCAGFVSGEHATSYQKYLTHK